MQATCVHTLQTNEFSSRVPDFCPKNCTAILPGPRNKALEKIRNLRTSFSESSLTDVKITKDHTYTHSVKRHLEWDFFQREPFFEFTFDDSMFLFLWTIDRLRRRSIISSYDSENEEEGLKDSEINEDQIEQWKSLLQYAEKIYNEFLEVMPQLNADDYTPNIRMIAILISMKFYYEVDRVLDAHFIRAFYLSLNGFQLNWPPEISRMSVDKMKVGITVYQIRKMEAIFLSTMFKHSQKEKADDSEHNSLQTNPKRSFGSSSI